MRLIAAVLALGVSGSHWAILQSVAWSRMIVAYSRTATLRTALEQTFDGQHPCNLCKAIQKEQQTERQQELQQPSVRHDTFFCEACFVMGADAFWSRLTLDASFTFPSRTDPPPVPPPRRLCCQA